ncbi:MAG: TIGR03905 family TSCPD domain-containing protein [Ruminococcaceae bacterium]|nr:TIGR03905 family TSCPD domain-containing protein [Oscillospiraceae bacterium]
MTYRPSGVCSRQIEVTLDGDVIKRVEFLGGCMGNTQGVARLVEGMTVQEAVSRLEGIECGRKGTSCPDQLAKAIIELVKKRK